MFAADAAVELHALRNWRDPETFHHWMRDDPGWATQVRFVCRVGIPLSEYLGRVPKPGEPRWTGYDRMVAEEFERWSAQVCPNCGLHPLDWENERDETHAGHMTMCFGCDEIAATKAQIPDDVSNERRSAYRIGLRRRSRRELLLLEGVEQGWLDDEVLDDLPDFT